MGNDDSKQTVQGFEGTGLWFQYLQQVQSSKKSEIVPYYNSQITFLQKIFRQLDKNNTNSHQLSDISTIPFIKEHPLAERIVKLFEEELIKIKTRKISFEIFLHLLTPFHVDTEVSQKFKFLFRLYDWDRDFKINHADLTLTFALMFRDKILFDKTLTNDSIKSMASEAISKYGTRGEIKLQQFMQQVPDDEVREVMTFRFWRGKQQYFS